MFARTTATISESIDSAAPHARKPTGYVLVAKNSRGITCKSSVKSLHCDAPEAEFWRRIDSDMIGEAFGIPDKDTDKDPNVKWSVPAPTILAS